MCFFGDIGNDYAMIHSAGLGLHFLLRLLLWRRGMAKWAGVHPRIRVNEQETKEERDATIFHHYGIATRTLCASCVPVLCHF